MHSGSSLGENSPLLDISTAFCFPAFGRRPSHTHHASSSAPITLTPIWFANSECRRLTIDIFYIRTTHAPQTAEPPRRRCSNQAQTLRKKTPLPPLSKKPRNRHRPAAGRERETSVPIMEAVLDVLSPQELMNVVYFKRLCNVEILRMWTLPLFYKVLVFRFLVSMLRVL